MKTKRCQCKTTARERSAYGMCEDCWADLQRGVSSGPLTVRTMRPATDNRAFCRQETGKTAKKSTGNVAG